MSERVTDAIESSECCAAVAVVKCVVEKSVVLQIGEWNAKWL